MFEYHETIYIWNGKFRDDNGNIYKRISNKDKTFWINEARNWGNLTKEFHNALEKNYNQIIREEKLKIILDETKI